MKINNYTGQNILYLMDNVPPELKTRRRVFPNGYSLAPSALDK